MIRVNPPNTYQLWGYNRGYGQRARGPPNQERVREGTKNNNNRRERGIGRALSQGKKCFMLLPPKNQNNEVQEPSEGVGGLCHTNMIHLKKDDQQCIQGTYEEGY